MSTSDTGDVVEITRRIPIPRSVSPQAHAALTAGNQMARHVRGQANPPLDDIDAWREHIRVRNMTVESFDTLFWFQLDYPGLLGGGHPATYRDIVFENFTVERAGTVFDAHAPAEAPLRDVTLRNITIKQADRTLVLENVADLKFENVTIAGQTVNGRLDWARAEAASR